MKETRALEALNKIEKIVKEVQDLFPNINKNKNQIPTTKDSDVVKILKRVNGIIANHNENNAERKLESLINFLSGVTKKK